MPRQIKSQGIHGIFLNLNPGAITRKKWRGNLLHPEILELQRFLQLAAGNGHIISLCLQAFAPHMDKVCSIVRKIYGRSPTEDLNDLDMDTAVWGIFMNVTLQAAVHLGRDYLENLRFTKSQLLKSVKQLFQVTEKSERSII